MIPENCQKIKLLKLWEILRRETDENHPLRTVELCDRLIDMGISCDLRTLARNVKLMQEYGYEIHVIRLDHDKAYYVINRDFSIPELKILIDVAGQKVGQYQNGKLEFVLPNRYIQNPSDDLILFKNDSKLSMCLTPFHEVLLQTSKGNLVKHPALLVADSLLSNKGCLGKILHSFCYENPCEKSKYRDDNDYRLQVAFCADGTLLLQNGKWKGRIRVKRDYKIQRLRELLEGRPYIETKDKEYSIFWYNPTVLSKSLYECFKDEDFTILREEIFKWDGDEERSLFRTTIQEDADFIQFVLVGSGRAVGINVSDRLGEMFKEKYTRKSILYTVGVYESTTTELTASKGSTVDVRCLEEKEPSYCFNVPSHNLVVRHNNRIFITGNCGKDISKADVSVNIYAWLKAQNEGKPVELCCAIGDDTVDGKPYSEIVEIAMEYIRSIGGFEKFAEWGLIR